MREKNINKKKTIITCIIIFVITYIVSYACITAYEKNKINKLISDQNNNEMSLNELNEENLIDINE